MQWRPGLPGRGSFLPRRPQHPGLGVGAAGTGGRWPCGAWCDLLLHILALPETGPIDPDAHRVLPLTSPARVQVLLRQDRRPGFGPVIPLFGLDAVEDFFATLSWSGPMYGWKFPRRPVATGDWPAHPSLCIDVRSVAGSHSLFWFNECGRGGGRREGRLLHRRDRDLRGPAGHARLMPEVLAEAGSARVPGQPGQ